MLGVRLPFFFSTPQRRFLFSYGAGALLVFALFTLLSLWLDARSKHRQEIIFNNQQKSQVMLARLAVEEHLDAAMSAAQIVTDHALAEFVRGQRDEESMISLYRTVESRIPSLLAIAFLETPVYFSTHATDYSHLGNDAQLLGIQWGYEYWDQMMQHPRDIFIPPFATLKNTQAMGMLLPVRADGDLVGIFAVVMDLGPAITRYIAPLRSGNEGSAFLLNGSGDVLFDHEAEIISKNILTTLHTDYPELLALDRRILAETTGTGAYTFTIRRGGPPVRKLVAWDSLPVGGQKLIVAMAAPDIEIDSVLENLRLERTVLGMVLLAALLGAGIVAYRHTVLHEIASAQRQVLDIIEFLPDPTFAVDHRGRIISWNQALEAMTGVPSEQMLGKGNMEYALPFYGERRKGLIDLLGQSIQAMDKRYVNVESDGHTLNAETFVPNVYGGKGAYVWATASLLLDQSGKPVGAIESIRNISDRIETEQALRQSEERFALAVAGANDGIWDWDLASDTVHFSPRWKEIIGYQDHEISSDLEEWQSRIHPDDKEMVRDANQRVAQGLDTHFSTEYRLRHKDGTYRWVLGRGAAQRDAAGNIVRMSGAHTDITKRKQSETISRILLEISSAVSTTHDLPDLYATVHDILKRHIGAENFLIALIDPKRDLIEFAYASDPYHGESWDSVPISTLGGASLTLAVFNAGKSMLLSKEEQIAQRVVGTPAEVWCGVPLRVRDKVIGVMSVQDYFDPNRYTEKDLTLLTSVSEQVAMAIERKLYEEQIRHQALHDSLTELPNRMLFSDRLESAMRRTGRRSGYCFAVLMMDLDRFKMVNDSHGHMVGDLLLMEAARRILPILRNVDTLARLGGDEFAVLLEEFEKPQQIIHIVRRIQESLSQPMRLDGHEIHTTASVGIVIRTESYDSPEEIMRDADIAMYQAKRQGKGLFRVFNASMHDQAVRAMAMENDMAMAMANDSFHLHFQPIFSTGELRLIGFEALLRWDHPSHGAVSPDKFIPVAEETGLIIPLGEWVLKQACTIMAQWHKDYPSCHDLFLSVNLSARQASQVNVVRHVRQALTQSGLAPQALKLELTETAVMKDPHTSLAHLERLKQLGVGLAIDDFGTGHSSLAYLSRFPVDALKVDHSFVCAIGDQPENLEIIRSVVALAETLGLTVIAEGVETAAQLAAVTELGCTAVQGFHLSYPLPPAEAEKLLQSC